MKFGRRLKRPWNVSVNRVHGGHNSPLERAGTNAMGPLEAISAGSLDAKETS